MTDTDRFYELLGALEARPGQGRPLADYTGKSGWPARGVYFFREPGEHRSGDPGAPRIVRVGTHAISTNSQSTMWGRLRTHRGSQDGRGNHRGSIFRLHVGTALLHRDAAEVSEVPTWGVGPSAPSAIRASEAAHERRVSAHLGSMPVLWVEIPDNPGPESMRAYIERNAIALLSNRLQPFDPPGDTWLGLHSPRPEIRRSGLWNLNHVAEAYDSRFLTPLARFVARPAER